MGRWVLSLAIWSAAVMAGGFAAAGEEPVQQTGPFRLSLVCGGLARGTQSVTSSTNFHSLTGDTIKGDITTTGRTSFEGRVRIRIVGDQGSITVPSDMIPPLVSGRDGGGAFKLTRLQVTDSTITGQFTFNLLNKPKFTIDRATGDIEMAGFGNGFSGVCDRLPDEPEARKF